MRGDFIVSEEGKTTWPIGHVISGRIGGEEYPVADPDDSRNVLTVRDRPNDPRQTVPRDRGRAQGTVMGPLFELHMSDFHWKSNPFGGVGRGRHGVEWSGGDYLLVYWLARAHGVIGPND